MMGGNNNKERSNTTKVILYRHHYIRRSLLAQLKRLERERQREERAHAQEVVLYLSNTAHHRERRSRHLARLFTMFRVKPFENEVGVESILTPVQQQQQQQIQQEPTAQANSSTESEISVGSYQSSSLSQGPAERAALWVADTPRRQRALSVDVPTEAPQDTPRRRSAPEVVVTHVALLDDADDRSSYSGGEGEASDLRDTQAAEGESREPSPTHAMNLPAENPTPSPSTDDVPPTHGRLSPTATPAAASGRTSPPRSSTRRLSRGSIRPGSRISRVSRTSLAFRKGGSSTAPTQQQESVVLTEISAPLEDVRSVATHQPDPRLANL